MVTKEYYTYNEILAKARTCKKSVEENQKLDVELSIFLVSWQTVCIKLRFAPLESQEHGFKLD